MRRRAFGRSGAGRGVVLRAGLATLFAVLPSLGLVPHVASSAEGYVPVSGAGSTWSQNAVDQWRRDVQQYGMRVNYSGTGSSDGRRQFLNGTVDFAASDIPFQSRPEDGSPPERPPAGSFAYMPVTAGGTVFMYNLTINGQRVTNLRLSGANIAKIFTGVLTKWNDPAIATDNPGLTMPDKAIVPVVRSDGSGSTAQFTIWMIDQQRDIWEVYCRRAGRSACGLTSYYPTVPGMIAQAGDLGVAGYVAQSYADGAVGYVNYSYALNAGFPVAKMLNAAGYYTEPTPSNVAVSLLKAKINTDESSEAYLTQQLEEVYADTDQRTYPLSSYSYLIIPTKVQGQFTEKKGNTLGAFSYYAMCQGQQQSASLGYSPMPINLVRAGFDQILKIPGVAAQDIKVESCNNPTFAADGPNKLAATAPMPEACDKQGPEQCATGTGGAKKSTPVKKATAATTTTTIAGAATPGSAPAAAPRANGSAPGPGGGTATTAPAKGTTRKATDGGGNLVATGPEAPAVQSCADTGDCAVEVDQELAVADGGQAVAAPLTLATESGWGGDQTLMVLAAVFALGVVLAPALTASAVGRRK